MKDGHYIQEMYNLRVEEIRQSISLVKEHQRVDNLLINQQIIPLVSIKELVFRI